MKQFALIACLLFATAAWAQKDPNQMTDKRMDEVTAALKKGANGWIRGGDIGLNLNGSSNRNRRLSDGVNQFGFGGIMNLFANNKLDKSFFENAFVMQLGALRNGGKSGSFLKNNDILRLNSTYGYSISGEKLFAALDSRLETQLLPSYEGGLLNGTKKLSQFLAPMSLMVAPGLAYKPNAQFSFFLSPIGIDFIYVGTDELANLVGQPLGNEAGKNNRLLLGPAFRAKYNNIFFNERVAFNSSLGWNANYRDNMNGRILWANQANIQVYKGLALKLLGEMFYDHYTKAIVQDAVGTTPQKLGLATTMRGGFFLAYSRIFGDKK